MRQAQRQKFQDTVWQHFELHGRHDLPWRVPESSGSFDPYKILVSEMMLQQTQVPRVIPKYFEFLARFPTVRVLAEAPLGDVLTAWSGLGYNRRAKFLWQTAQDVTNDFGGIFPRTVEELTRLPGVGKNTAGAIIAYAHNQPIVFVETNIRTTYIYHFFENREDVSDEEILALVRQTLPAGKGNYRDWYWALMDYGSLIKQTIGNLNKLSKSYNKQSVFMGSRRQIRGQIIKLLADKPLSKSELGRRITDERLESVLDDLTREKLIKESSGLYSL